MQKSKPDAMLAPLSESENINADLVLIGRLAVDRP
jgi:hypothetical protein